MSTSSDPLPPELRRAQERARQKLALMIALGAIGTSGALAVVMLRHFPLALRLLIAVSDLTVMAALWLVARQKFSGK